MSEPRDTPTRVTAYSSFTYAVEPRTFVYQGSVRRVETITQAWRTPAQIHFYVRDEQNDFFELTYTETQDQWSVRTFGKTCPPKG